MFVYNFEMLELMVSLSDTYKTCEKDLFLLAVTYEDLGFDLRPSPASQESRILILASRCSPSPLSLPPLAQCVHLEISGCAAVIAAACPAAFCAPHSSRRIAAGLAAVVRGGSPQGSPHSIPWRTGFAMSKPTSVLAGID